jgi:hypothetical protein
LRRSANTLSSNLTASVNLPRARHVAARLPRALPAQHIKNKSLRNRHSENSASIISPHMPLTYVRMVFGERATEEHHHVFLQLNSFCKPSKGTVYCSKIAKSFACTAY